VGLAGGGGGGGEVLFNPILLLHKTSWPSISA
jgi:hypothetical protein